MTTRISYALLIGSILISGCSGLGSQPAPQVSAEELAQFADTTPTQLVNNAEATLKKAREAELNFYAPQTFARMEQVVREIQSIGKKPDADKKQLVALSKALDQSMQTATSNKATVLAQLADVIDQKKVLDELNTAKLFPSDYKSVVDDTVDLIEYIEDGKADKARAGAAEVIKDMRELEVRAIKETVLGKATTALAEAEDKNAKDHARKSFEEATTAYDRAIKLIETSPRSRDEIQKLGANATFLAQRSVRVIDEVLRLQQIKPKDMEQVALDGEARLHRISEAMKHQDVRNLSLNDQSAALVQAAEKLTAPAEINEAKPDVETLKAEFAKLEAALAKSESERKALQAKLEAAAAVENAESDPNPVVAEPVPAEPTAAAPVTESPVAATPAETPPPPTAASAAATPEAPATPAQ